MGVERLIRLKVERASTEDRLQDLKVLEVGPGWGWGVDAFFRLAPKLNVSIGEVSLVEISPAFRKILRQRFPSMEDFTGTIPEDSKSVLDQQIQPSQLASEINVP